MNRKMLFVGLTALVALLLVTAAGAQTSASFDMGWHVLAGGGGRAASTHYAADSTLGQAAVGLSAGAAYRMRSGYWQAFAPVQVPYVIYLPLALRR